jgi:hypothetical protein
VVDILAVPQWLEDAVCETKDQKILDRFFAKIVVDSVNLFFIENRSQLFVEFTRAFKIGPERLFDNDPRPASFLRARQLGLAKLFCD